MLPKFEIFVGQDLSFSVQIFGWMLTEDHEIYSMYERSFLNVTLSNFIHQLKELYFVMVLLFLTQVKNLTAKDIFSTVFLRHFEILCRVSGPSCSIST